MTAQPRRFAAHCLDFWRLAVSSAAVMAVAFALPVAGGEKDVSDRVLRHVVLFKFKDSTSEGQVKELENAFGRLPSEIDVIHDFEWGTDVSSENLSQGFTHCFLVTFKTEKDRDAYLPHKAHQEFVGLIKPYLEKVLVVDYWTGR